MKFKTIEQVPEELKAKLIELINKNCFVTVQSMYLVKPSEKPEDLEKPTSNLYLAILREEDVSQLTDEELLDAVEGTYHAIRASALQRFINKILGARDN
jgi:hypothetical protein